VGNGTMVSFEAPDRASIDAFHAAALAAGCPDEGAPGTRGWAPNAYAAYTRDLDGNKLAVYCFKAALILVAIGLILLAKKIPKKYLEFK